MVTIQLTTFLIGALIVIFTLALCVLYLVFVYRKLLEKYNEIILKTNKNELKTRIRLDADKFVDKKIDYEISKATEEAVNLIAKNANLVAKDMRRKAIEKLKEEDSGQLLAVSQEYDNLKTEIEKYKAEKMEEIKKNALEILKKVSFKALLGSFDQKAQEESVTKALEDAKRQNLL